MKAQSLFGLALAGMVATPVALAGVVPAGTKSNPCTAANHSDEVSDPAYGLYNVCKDGISGAVTSIENLRLTLSDTRQRSLNRADEQQNTAYHPQHSGMAAGNMAGNANVWATLGYNEFESTFIAAAYEAETSNFMLGYDALIGPASVLGMSVGYEDLSTTTFYNGGGNDSEGFIFAPYYGIALTDRLTFDIQAGYASLDNDQYRVDPANAATLTASYDAERWFTALNLSHGYAFDSFLASARIGYTHAWESQDGYTETGGPSARTVRDRDIELSQAELGFDLTYLGQNFSPYASLTLRYDLDIDEDAAAGGLPAGNIVRSDDRSEADLLIGVDYAVDDITLSLQANQVMERDEFDKWGIALGLRMPL